jgi:hypothetical protein
MVGGAMTYNLCTLFVKLSILCFFLRFSIDRAFRMAVYVVMFITVGYTIPNAFLFLYICRPIAFYWDWAILDGVCLDQQAVFDAANILNMLTDFMILLLPIWMLRPLRVPLLKKIGIALVLMTGGLYVLPKPPTSPTLTTCSPIQRLRHQHHAHGHGQDGRLQPRHHLALPGESDLVVRNPFPRLLRIPRSNPLQPPPPPFNNTLSNPTNEPPPC